MVEKADLPVGSDLFFDNLFTSFPLLKKLSDLGIAGTGTVRQNRLHRVPIRGKKDLENKTNPRGTVDVVYSSDQVLVGWKDSKAVYMASNKYGADTDKNCSRFSRTEKKSISVPIPAMFKQYNEGMGGVDLLDNMVAVYRIPFRMKKWWFPFYTWSLSVSAVNAWRLRCKVKKQREPFLDFLRELVVDMMATHGLAPMRRNSLTSVPVDRYDGLHHWPQPVDQNASGKPLRRNCKLCYELLKKEKKASFTCKKCSVALHIECFEESIHHCIVHILEQIFLELFGNFFLILEFYARPTANFFI